MHETETVQNLKFKYRSRIVVVMKYFAMSIYVILYACKDQLLYFHHRADTDMIWTLPRMYLTIIIMIMSNFHIHYHLRILYLAIYQTPKYNIELYRAHDPHVLCICIYT